VKHAYYYDLSRHNCSLRFFLNVEKVYNETLAVVKQNFPQYVNELQGIADGAHVEFYKVSLAREGEQSVTNWV
jgi:hypothetical protein